MINPIKEGMTQTSRDNCQPNPIPSAIGILTPDAIVAKVTIEAVYKLVIIATLWGNLSLITLGNKTLQIATPNPMQNVPKNKKNTIEIDRKLIPITKINNPIVKVNSFVSLFANLGAIGETSIKAIKGKLVSNATFQLENPTSSRIVPIKGPTDVIAGRKLNATNKIAHTSNIWVLLLLCLC